MHVYKPFSLNSRLLFTSCYGNWDKLDGVVDHSARVTSFCRTFTNLIWKIFFPLFSSVYWWLNFRDQILQILHFTCTWHQHVLFTHLNKFSFSIMHLCLFAWTLFNSEVHIWNVRLIRLAMLLPDQSLCQLWWELEVQVYIIIQILSLLINKQLLHVGTLTISLSVNKTKSSREHTDIETGHLQLGFLDI